MTGLVGMIVRPLLVELAATIGWIAVALATVFGQAIVMYVALTLVPGASFDSFWTAVAAAWIAAAFGTVLVWLTSAGTDESFAASLLRLKPAEIDDPDVDGVRLRPARRGLVPGGAVGAPVGQHAHPAPLGRRGHATPPTSGRSSCPAPRPPASRPS